MSIGSTPEPQPASGFDESSVAINDVLMGLWHRRRPEVINGLEHLIALLQNANRFPGDKGKLIEAAHVAHQLHGVFGVFGWDTLKERLGAIEQALIGNDPHLDIQVATAESVLAELP